ncbi:hypothetical protein, partial [Polymorphobacter multimanifer]
SVISVGWILQPKPNRRSPMANRDLHHHLGHDLLAAFTALIRLVDEGHGALEISLLFSLASRRLPDEDDD